MRKAIVKEDSTIEEQTLDGKDLAILHLLQKNATLNRLV